jgi:hypothetical protein
MQLTKYSWTIKSILATGLVSFLTIGGPALGQDATDPHRPLCTGAQCRKVKSFAKTHYCGAPVGNGPDDGCEIRHPKKLLNIKVSADFDCKWVDGIRNCQQHGQPSSELRGILVGKLRGLGLPPKAKGQIYFTIWQSIGSDWSLVEAYYDHIAGSDVTLCQLIATIGKDSHVSVLRKVPFQKTDADKNAVTTWSPLIWPMSTPTAKSRSFWKGTLTKITGLKLMA